MCGDTGIQEEACGGVTIAAVIAWAADEEHALAFEGIGGVKNHLGEALSGVLH